MPDAQHWNIHRALHKLVFLGLSKQRAYDFINGLMPVAGVFEIDWEVDLHMFKVDPSTIHYRLYVYNELNIAGIYNHIEDVFI